MTRIVSAALALLILPSAGAVHAAAPTVEPASDLRTVAITISPIPLPIFELTVEGRISDQIGLAGIVGFGFLETDADRTDVDESFTAYAFGASLRGYVVGDFDHGMQIGAEVLYLGVDAEAGIVSANGLGFAFGPFIGYKISHDAGFNFDVQLGAQYVLASVSAEDGDQSGETRADGIIPLFNLNIGWAF